MEIYTLGKPDAQGNIDFTNSDGLAYRGQWKELEPREGQYNWTQPDTALRKAKEARKLISISITAGARTPQWVFDAGAQFWTYQGGGTGPPGTYTMPMPWDKLFLRTFKRFLEAFHARYGSEITHTNVGGINSDTQEVLLPAEVNGGYPANLNERLEEAWRSLLDFYQSTFRVPFFGMHGRWFLPEPDITSRLIDLGIANYPKYGLQWNGWGYKPMWEQVTKNVGKCQIGLQEGTELNNEAAVKKAMGEATQVGAQFGEMYSGDLKYAGYVGQS